jgi:hypothetical protein
MVVQGAWGGRLGFSVAYVAESVLFRSCYIHPSPSAMVVRGQGGWAGHSLVFWGAAVSPVA